MHKIILKILQYTYLKLEKYVNYLKSLERSLARTGNEEITPHSLWIKDNGDKTLRLDYPLAPDDIVLDVGGYEGQWASDIFSRYLCSIHIFEPIPHYASMIEKRFSNNNQIKLYKFGLGKIDEEIEFSVAGDASSAVMHGNQSIKALVVSFSKWFKENNISKVSLMKVNIEGGEYELLEHLIETGLIKKVNNLQVQFHNFFTDAESRMQAIQLRLQNSHDLTYQYKFIWENWKLKDINEC